MRGLSIPLTSVSLLCGLSSIKGTPLTRSGRCRASAPGLGLWLGNGNGSGSACVIGTGVGGTPTNDDIGNIEGRLGGQVLPRIRIASGLGIVNGSRHRVHQYGGFQVLGVWRSILKPDEGVADHHLTHGLVGKTSADLVLRLVCLIGRRLDSTEDVARVNDHNGTSDLSETERRLREDSA